MREKINAQNELIEDILDWIRRDKPLGYSNARNAIDEYEKKVKLFDLPVVSTPVKITKCKSFKIHNPYEVDTEVNKWLSSNKIVIKNVQQTNVKHIVESRYNDSTHYITLITIFYEDA